MKHENLDNEDALLAIHAREAPPANRRMREKLGGCTWHTAYYANVQQRSYKPSTATVIRHMRDHESATTEDVAKCCDTTLRTAQGQVWNMAKAGILEKVPGQRGTYRRGPRFAEALKKAGLE